MKKTSRLLLSIPFLFLISHSALAAATAEEATRLQNLFQSYLSNEPGVVKVEATGDDYTATFDVAPLPKKYATSDESLTMTPYVMKLTPQGSGLWGVSHSGPFNMSFNAPGVLKFDVKMESYDGASTFDEKLLSFVSGTGSAKNIKVLEEITDSKGDKTLIDISMADFSSELTGAANPNGGLDFMSKYKYAGLTETFSGGAVAATGEAGLNFSVTAESGTQNSNGKGVKWKSILDLISFFSTHKDPASVGKDQAALKALMIDGLPFFENINGDGVINKISVTTPIGPVTVDSVAFKLDANGAVANGKFREGFTFSGLSIPQAIVPPWAATMVPKNLTIDIEGSDFNLLESMKQIIAQADFTKDPPVEDAFMASIMPVFLPKGAAIFTLHPTSISNDIYSFDATGSMTAGPASLPSGSATVKAKGLDEIMKVVQAAPPEMGLQQYGAVIIAAKGMGKAGADGTLSWDIATTPEGKVTVNGIDPMKLQ